MREHEARVQSIPISKKMGDLPGFRENLIPKLLTTRQKRGLKMSKSSSHGKKKKKKKGSNMILKGFVKPTTNQLLRY